MIRTLQLKESFSTLQIHSFSFFKIYFQNLELFIYILQEPFYPHPDIMNNSKETNYLHFVFLFNFIILKKIFFMLFHAQRFLNFGFVQNNEYTAIYSRLYIYKYFLVKVTLRKVVFDLPCKKCHGVKVFTLSIFFFLRFTLITKIFG